MELVNMPLAIKESGQPQNWDLCSVGEQCKLGYPAMESIGFADSSTIWIDLLAGQIGKATKTLLDHLGKLLTVFRTGLYPLKMFHPESIVRLIFSFIKVVSDICRELALVYHERGLMEVVYLLVKKIQLRLVRLQKIWESGLKYGKYNVFEETETSLDVDKILIHEVVTAKRDVNLDMLMTLISLKEISNVMDETTGYIFERLKKITKNLQYILKNGKYKENDDGKLKCISELVEEINGHLSETKEIVTGNINSSLSLLKDVSFTKIESDGYKNPSKL